MSTDTGRIVIVAYRPHAGRAADVLQLLRRHHKILSGEGLVTERAQVLMRAADGTLLEVFEWASQDAIEAAHGNEAVKRMWEAFEAVCDFVALTDIAEAAGPFAEFAAVDPEPDRPSLPRQN